MVCARGGATSVLCPEVTFSWTQVAEDKKDQEGDDDHNDDDDEDIGRERHGWLLLRRKLVLWCVPSELQRLSFFWVASQSPFELKDAHHHHYQQLHIIY
ncbi:hypothetical protein CY35_11G044100 [Sphagnum magellanicum]|nr:hypothetical protein CY35_11G044100 [Sphagnum magellanicum]